MADHYWATLKVGGRVTAEQLREIVRLAVADGVELIECPAALRPLLSEEGRLEVVTRPQQAVLELTGEADWGAFETLERICDTCGFPMTGKRRRRPASPPFWSASGRAGEQ